MRKLATIRRISKLEPIAGADRIELAHVGGWKCVVKKGEFEEGDLCVYFEIDSLLPEKEWCEFMRERKFRVKTIKLRGQISQGLCLSLETVGVFAGWSEGDDLTERLGVSKWEPYVEQRARENQRQPVPYKWLLRVPFGRWLHMKLYPRAKGSWPEYMPKTDEERVQNIDVERYVSKDIYVTEKIDGQSCTFFYAKDEKTGLFSRGLFGVCSRNMWLKVPDSSNWWTYAKENNIEQKISLYCRGNGRSLAFQGELYGPGIQGNKYQVAARCWRVYNIFDIDEQRYLNLAEKQEILKALQFQHVPLLSIMLYDNPYLPITAEDWLEWADGNSLVGKGIREGVVVRQVKDDSVSFKAISNEFLLKHGE